MKQERHEKILNFISQFSQYQKNDGEPRFSIVKNSRNSRELHKIEADEISLAVILFTDALNIEQASEGNVDLYRLLQAYLLAPEFRAKFNELSTEALKYIREEV